ncbi:AMP-binding protein [Actinokineospora sp.]|uniref:AMP-binding protein n=1 Tax=Actinokineospora sp. TaxID=1872133 RepID=UPI004037645B
MTEVDVRTWPAHFATAPGLCLEEIVRPVGATGSFGFLDDDGGRQSVTYDELARRVVTAAVRLRRRGVERGSPVAITLRNSLPVLIAALGVWAAGGTLVSLPPQANKKDGTYAERFGAVLAAMGCAHHLVGADADPVVGRPARFPIAELQGTDGRTDPEVSISDTALVQFTSGSLGTPKGVAIGRDALAGHLKMISRCFGMDAGRDKVVTWLPMYHDLGLVCFLGPALYARVPQVHFDPRAFVLDPSRWITLLARERATISGAPNFGFRLASRVPYPGDLDLSRMRSCLNAAERVLWSDIEDFHRAVGPLGFPWEAIMPAYGLAEGTVGASCAVHDRGPIQGPGGHVSLGPPLPGNRLTVSNDTDPGTLHLDGDWLFDGYWTADGFLPRTTTPFDTNDASFLHDGELYVLGRHSDVASIGGHNVFAEDVEAVAIPAAGLPGVGCAAFKYDSGAGERFGVVIEIVRDARDLAPDIAKSVRSAISAALGTRVAPLVVARAGIIPRTTSGKPQRGPLRTACLSGTLPANLVYTILT